MAAPASLPRIRRSWRLRDPEGALPTWVGGAPLLLGTGLLLAAGLLLVTGCGDGSNVSSPEEAVLLLETAATMARLAERAPPEVGEWVSDCPDGGLVSFRREVRGREPATGDFEDLSYYRADVTISLDHCQTGDLLLLGVIVVETESTDSGGWTKYWGDLAAGETQETYCRFDAEVHAGSAPRGTICGIPSSEFELPEFP